MSKCKQNCDPSPEIQSITTLQRAYLPFIEKRQIYRTPFDIYSL